MDKVTKILMLIWSVLAIASFVCGFFTTPLIAKIIGIAFGVQNMMIIGGLIYSKIIEKRAAKKKLNEEEGA